MNPFEHITRQLQDRCWPANKVNSVELDEYETFCKEYVFDQLRGISFGEAFCRKFIITDYVLSVLPSEQSARQHIKTIGYIKI